MPYTLTDLLHWVALQSRTSYAQFAANADVLALTLDGEGRSQDILGRTAIAWTVKNRQLGLGPRADAGKSITDICLRRLQYSTWFAAGGASNYARQMTLTDAVINRLPDRGGFSPSQWAKFSESRYLAVGVLHGNLLDPTGGATHYLTERLYATNPPKWVLAATGVTKIGDHIFLRGVR